MAYSPELPGFVALHPTSESVVITSIIIVGVIITFSSWSCHENEISQLT